MAQTIAFNLTLNGAPSKLGLGGGVRHVRLDVIGGPTSQVCDRLRIVAGRVAATRLGSFHGADALSRTKTPPKRSLDGAPWRTDEAKARYRQRSPVVEFCHAWIKSKLGLRQFHVRGLVKAKAEMLWAALTYNIQLRLRLLKLHLQLLT